jgi:hypothetical protein
MREMHFWVIFWADSMICETWHTAAKKRGAIVKENVPDDACSSERYTGPQCSRSRARSNVSFVLLMLLKFSR